jgi:GAF domain-containing protein
MWVIVSRQIIQSIEQYRDRLDRILHFTRELREEIYGDILLDKIIDYSLSITNSDAGSVLTLDGDNLVFKIVKGKRAADLIEKSIPKGTGIAGWVIEKGKSVRIADVKNDDRYNPEIDSITGYETRSVLSVPLKMRTGIIGAIELLNKKDGDYSERDEEMILYLADQAAVSIDRAKFYDDRKLQIHVTDILLGAIDFQIPEKSGHSESCNLQHCGKGDQHVRRRAEKALFRRSPS